MVDNPPGFGFLPPRVESSLNPMHKYTKKVTLLLAIK